VKNPSTQKVKMQVENGLSRPGACIEHRPVSTSLQSALPRQLRCHHEHPAKKSGVVSGGVFQRGKVLTRHNEGVNRRLGMSVLEGHDFIILEDDPGGQAPFHNPAENTLIHVTLDVSYQTSELV
jgi:hypothetical protein